MPIADEQNLALTCAAVRAGWPVSTRSEVVSCGHCADSSAKCRIAPSPRQSATRSLLQTVSRVFGGTEPVSAFSKRLIIEIQNGRKLARMIVVRTDVAPTP